MLDSDMLQPQTGEAVGFPTFGGRVENPAALSALTLAFIGDGVYELLVREQLLQGGDRPVNAFHAQAVALVRCETQAAFARNILLPVLTQAEQAVYNRGRNARVGHIPKNAQVADYHAATALEAVFGYLYLNGEYTRITQLFKMMIASK